MKNKNADIANQNNWLRSEGNKYSKIAPKVMPIKVPEIR